MCDKSQDCTDHSDEDFTLCWEWQRSNCTNKPDDDPTCSEWACPGGYWKCNNYTDCIVDKYVCDNETHCDEDESDEDPVICAQWDCLPGYWKSIINA